MDRRHVNRQHVIQELYAMSFTSVNSSHYSQKTQAVHDNQEKLDEYIRVSATKYAVDKIAKVDLAILRLALYELAIEKKIPPKVVINEAVELAKELGADKSPGFINAVLGKVYETISNHHDSTE